jgi:alpha-glucan,water dikinase
MLDCALENWFMTKMTQSDKWQVDRDGLVEMLAMNVEHMALSYGRDWWMCKDMVYKLKDMNRWGVEWGRQAKSVLDRVSLALQAQAEEIYSMVQPKAEEFGKALGTKESYLTNFAEEVIRGSGGLDTSQILQALSGHVRAAGQLGVWELASSVSSATGELKIMEDLVAIQGQSFEVPQVLIVNKIGGMEDIPPGVVAILSPNAVDVLSHIAIRARNQKVLLASCHDEAVLSQMKEVVKAHKYVEVSLDSTQQVVVKAAQGAGTAAAAPAAAANVKVGAVDLGPSKAKYVLTDKEFAHGCLGPDSLLPLVVAISRVFCSLCSCASVLPHLLAATLLCPLAATLLCLLAATLLCLLAATLLCLLAATLACCHTLVPPCCHTCLLPHSCASLLPH